MFFIQLFPEKKNVNLDFNLTLTKYIFKTLANPLEFQIIFIVLHIISNNVEYYDHN